MSQRSEMEKVIRSGGAVIHKGVHYRSISALPSEADMALGDPDREAEAAKELSAEVERLNAELAKLKKTSKADEPAKSKDVAKDAKSAKE